MPKAATVQSLTDLEKIMADRQNQLETLLKKREDLEDVVKRLDQEIKAFLSPGGPGRKTGPRPRNSAPLRKVLRGVLAKNKKGLSLTDLAQQISETGYKTQSDNFKNIVYQCLHKMEDVGLDRETGLYKLKK